MLRTVRIILAALTFTLVTLLFLDISGALHIWFGWMAKIQLLPAVLALNFVVVAALALLTLLLGRVYCSVICPLGIMQDIINWFSSRRKGKKMRFGFRKERRWLRYGVLAVFVALMVAGLASVATLIAPYSAFGKIAGNLLAPLYGWGNNLLAKIAEHYDSYAFYTREVYVKSVAGLVTAVVTFVVIAIFAWKGGRAWCNNICPVGSALSLLSRFALLGPVIDTDKCINCGRCGKMCKASCIDTKNHKVDMSRCVVCMDCLNNCSAKAISYKIRRGAKQAAGETPSDPGRRNALAIIGMAASTATLKAAQDEVDGGFAVILDKQVPVRETPLAPAGSGSLKHFAQHCIGCQLCVSECPNKVLRPSVKLGTFMQPEMSYEKGYCRPECTRCSEVCPAGAITRITREEKSSIQIGHAVWIKDNCVVIRDNVECGHCAERCPSGAIIMVKLNPDEPRPLLVPSVDTERCIGCGACENLCPARPLSAIYVEGHPVHKEL